MRAIDVADLPITPPADPGAAPMLQWVPLDWLVIDDSYQRGLAKSNWSHIRKIAAAFSWSKFSPVFCAPIEGGLYAVIDGQHRAHAAALCGFKEVPAQIVQMTKPEQAAAFAAVNGDTIKVTTWQVFRSALEALEPWALACRDAVEAAGCTLMNKNKNTISRLPGEIFAFREIRRLVEADRAASVTLALVALKSSETGKDPEMWSDEFLRPWLAAVADRPHLNDAAALSAFLDTFDAHAALDRSVGFIRQRRRLGEPAPPKHDLVGAEIGTALDATFLRTRMRAAE